MPGPEPLGNLLRKRDAVARDFTLYAHQVIFLSAETGFCVKDLVFRMILAVPDGKKLPFLDKVSPAARSKEAVAEAKRGFFSDAIKWIKDNTLAMGEYLWRNREHLVAAVKLGKDIYEMFRPSGKKRAKAR